MRFRLSKPLQSTLYSLNIIFVVFLQHVNISSLILIFTRDKNIADKQANSIKTSFIINQD